MRESMMGSGIYSYTKAVTFVCPMCDCDIEDDLYVNDWGSIDQYVKCPTCDRDIMFRQEAGEEDYVTGYFGEDD